MYKRMDDAVQWLLDREYATSSNNISAMLMDTAYVRRVETKYAEKRYEEDENTFQVNHSTAQCIAILKPDQVLPNSVANELNTYYPYDNVVASTVEGLTNAGFEQPPDEKTYPEWKDVSFLFPKPKLWTESETGTGALAGVVLHVGDYFLSDEDRYIITYIEPHSTTMEGEDSGINDVTKYQITWEKLTFEEDGSTIRV